MTRIVHAVIWYTGMRIIIAFVASTVEGRILPKTTRRRYQTPYIRSTTSLSPTVSSFVNTRRGGVTKKNTPPVVTTTKKMTSTTAANHNEDEGSTSLKSLCLISKKACEIMTPMIQKFYRHCNGIDSEGVQLKADASVFTIADGIVQNLLVSHLFRGELFESVIGEEDDTNAGVVITGDGPYAVDGLSVPPSFKPTIDECREKNDCIVVRNTQGCVSRVDCLHRPY